MARYFYVPVTTRYVSIDDKPIVEALKDVDNELYEREITRREITYSENSTYSEDEIREFNGETSLIYNEKRLPEKIILMVADGMLMDIVTETKLSCKNSTFLDVFQITTERLLEIYVENEFYNEAVENFFNKSKKKKTSLEKVRGKNFHS